jgi:hypothetical protein
MLSIIKNLINLLYSYRKLLIKVIFFEIYYSFKYLEFSPTTKIDKDNPCSYYFLFKISKFIEERKIKSMFDLGSGYGRILNFIYDRNKIRVGGIELNKNLFDKSLKLKKSKIKIYFGNILSFNFIKFDPQCFILNDPLKTKSDIKKLISKILRFKKKNKDLYVISINMSDKTFPKKFRLLEKYKASKTKSLNFYKIL